MLKVRNLSKKFGEVYALKGIDFHLKKGEIHGIVGANGSGKSTFLNVIFGDDNISKTGGYSGEIFIDDEVCNIKNSKYAMDLGIGKVHQEFALISSLDVASNIKINKENTYKFDIVNKQKNHEESKALLESFEIYLDTKKLVKDLSVNIKQFIEIAREVDKQDLKILLLDEPTACFNKEDASMFMQIIRKLKDKGISIIFISHRLDEITSLCDKITVFRDGKIVSDYDRDKFCVEKIAIDMIGKKVNKASKNTVFSNDKNNKSVISFKNINIYDGNRKFEDINLDIKEGEILGITGLAGHGHTILGNTIMGLNDYEGEISYYGDKLNIKKVHETIQKGIVMLPDERKELGVLLNSTVKENIIFTSCYSKNKFLKLPKLKGLSFLNKSNIDNFVDEQIDKMNIKCSCKNQKVGQLSGGNQQKICISRLLATEPRVLFVGEPTRGIDLYSKEIILNMLIDMNKEKDTTIVIASSEIDELKRVCDRIIVMYEGKIFDILSPSEDEEVFSLAISGKRRAKNA